MSNGEPALYAVEGRSNQRRVARMTAKWTECALGNLVELRNGVNFTQTSRGQSVKVVGVGDFQEREVLSEYSQTSLVTVDGDVQEESLLAEDDLLFVRSNGNKALVGRCVLVKNVTERITFSGFTIRARIRDPRVDPTFLSKLVRSGIFQRHLHWLGSGSSISNLGQDALASFRFMLPPLCEQKAISQLLRTWDEALDRLHVLRDKLVQKRQWFRREVLSGNKRFPGFDGDWELLPLSRVLVEHGDRGSGGEEVYSVSVHKGLVNQVEHLGRSFAAKDTSNYNLVFPGDIVYTKSPTGSFPLGIIKRSNINRRVLVSPLYGVFTPATQHLGIILDAYFESPVTVANYLRPLVQKGAKNTIAVTNQRFLEGRLRLPRDAREQAAIASLLAASAHEIACIDSELCSLQVQKRGLMQKLLTGEWRVKA